MAKKKGAYDADFIVMGSGPGGQRAAIQAAKLGKRVVVIERDDIGGGCLHKATIPSKTLREAALSPDCNIPNPLPIVMNRKRQVIEDEVELLRSQFERNGVTFLKGIGSLVSAEEVRVQTPETGAQQTLRSPKMVLATGARPLRPRDIPFHPNCIYDSDTILEMTQLPRTLAVLGAGVIGCEYASILGKLGVRVTLMDKRDSLLPSVDREIVQALIQHFSNHNVQLELASSFEKVQLIEPDAPEFGAKLEAGGKLRRFDGVLCCLGRQGNVEDLGLENAGVSYSDRGLVPVNEHYQTSQPHIYAVGDLIGAPALAASSAEQGRLAANHAFGKSSGQFPETFPYGIYTVPEISSAGYLEEQLRAKNIPYVVGRAQYREIARGKILGDQFGFLKLLVHRKTKQLLGIHIIGTGATELIHIGQVVMALKTDVEFLVNNVFNYPTLAEAYKVAAYNASNQIRSGS